jgi:hypothetical protein
MGDVNGDCLPVGWGTQKEGTISQKGAKVAKEAGVLMADDVWHIPDSYALVGIFLDWDSVIFINVHHTGILFCICQQNSE